MSDKFTCCGIQKLLSWILAEEKRGRIFGIPRELFFVPQPGDVFRMKRYGQELETPVGVAAGPHTQLSQNIISAWLTGARYIELKTIQTLDELEITRPCIDMTDEGYNCEWSQELQLEQSFSEYLNAWIILHILKDKFGWGAAGSPGFIFNMSVGYDLAGIMAPNVQRFLDKMADCRVEKTRAIDDLAGFYPRVIELEIPDRISDNITISTMHGCPPDEIEKIGRYFIEERGLNTTIKLNPTLLGPARLRHILNGKLEFEVEVPDEAFEHDLKYDDGIALIKSLSADALKAGVEFNLKLTNTLEAANRNTELPAREKMVYMSGRALHPISIDLARRLQKEFDGKLDISFSAGVDCFNVADVLACNLRPVTVCSDILKPGGYGRLGQYLAEINKRFAEAGAGSIEAFVKIKDQNGNPTGAGLANLEAYGRDTKTGAAFKKSRFPYDNIKISRQLTAFDCVRAPCVSTCPVSQDIPAYMYHTAEGNYQKALEVILETNPFPNLQGMVCDQLCRFKCTRMNYDSPLLIREIKRFIAQNQTAPIARKPGPANGLSVAVIGAGPSGLACAYFLALDGFAVDVFETKDIAGGMAADGIPSFRLDENLLKKDIAGVVALGVRIHYGSKITPQRFDELRKDHDYVYIAVGAQQAMRLGVPGEDAPGVFDHLGFLSAVRHGRAPDLGKNVVVIGGGNAAIDAARTAGRLVGPGGCVRIVYRRTRKEMPADGEEIQAALDEGIELIELTAPDCLLVENGRVTANVCFKMELGEKDIDGRPRPIRIEGSEFDIKVDSVISAIGQRVALDFLPDEARQFDPDTFETRLSHVFAGGDAVRGASTLIKAIGDGKRVAETIKQRATGQFAVTIGKTDRDVDFAALQVNQARRVFGPRAPEILPDRRLGFDLVTQAMDAEAVQQEARRCLQCDLICNICTTVCPNRANIAYTIAPMEFNLQRAMRSNGGIRIENTGRAHISQKFQILNLGDFCNECGNCTTFCPTDGAPFRIKPRFFLSSRSFSEEPNGYMFEDGKLKARVDGELESLSRQADKLFYETKQVRARLDLKTFEVEEITFSDDTVDSVDLSHAVRLAVLFTALRNFYLFDEKS